MSKKSKKASAKGASGKQPNEIIAFWNNKGGTGKTTLIFQSVLAYARAHPDSRVLVLDLCPQANFSELLLGGLVGRGGDRLIEIQARPHRPSVGGYFQTRLPQPYTTPSFDPHDYIIRPADFSENVPDNVYMLAGDPLLELQATAVSTLANNQIPGSNPWLNVIDWLKDFVSPIRGDYDRTFIDCNPSFSIYTQIALSIADSVVVPVMADDSSRRALQNAFSLIYGLHLPSPIYAQHSFASKLKAENRELPRVHTIVKNRLTQYMGPASAYSAVLNSIDRQVETLLQEKPEIFKFNKASNGMYEMRDFGTTGVVANAFGKSFHDVKENRYSIGQKRVAVRGENLKLMRKAMSDLVQRL